MAKGFISWVNPPENKGKITRTDDGSNEIYEYAINAGNTIDGYVPKLDEKVEFEPGSGKTATAIAVEKAVLRIIYFVAEGNLLKWNTEGATEGSIDNGIGNITHLLPQGEMIVRDRGTFTLTITNGTDEASAKATIN